MKRGFFTVLIVAAMLRYFTATGIAGRGPSDGTAFFVIHRYVAAHQKWKPPEYRIERHGSEGANEVYWVIWLAEEKRGYPGGGKSFEVIYDPRTQQVVEELGFQ